MYQSEILLYAELFMNEDFRDLVSSMGIEYVIPSSDISYRPVFMFLFKPRRNSDRGWRGLFMKMSKLSANLDIFVFLCKRVIDLP